MTGPEKGWPPQPRQISNIREVPWQEVQNILSGTREAEVRQLAIRDARVSELLGDRYAFIGSSMLESSKEARASSRAGIIQLTFFSHANNVAVEVEIADAKVLRALRHAGYQPPEGPDEVKAALAAALADNRIPQDAGTLEGTGILAWPAEGAPGAGHRVIHVTFAKPGEDVPRYEALVDLTIQKVLAAGQATHD